MYSSLLAVPSCRLANNLRLVPDLLKDLFLVLDEVEAPIIHQMRNLWVAMRGCDRKLIQLVIVDDPTQLGAVLFPYLLVAQGDTSFSSTISAVEKHVTYLFLESNK